MRSRGGQLVDKTGKRFGMLVITGFHSLNKNRGNRWFVRCDCARKSFSTGRT